MLSQEIPPSPKKGYFLSSHAEGQRFGLPEFSDQDGLMSTQYSRRFYAGIQSLRCVPVFLLTSVPHKVMESDTYECYYIPAGSTIIANAWGMLHDPAVFAELGQFCPERWLSPSAPAFPNQAFGFGARQCPGRFLARASMWSTMVGILAAFDIKPTEGGLPEEAYSSGFLSYPVPFRCYIRPRSKEATSLVQATETEG